MDLIPNIDHFGAGLKISEIIKNPDNYDVELCGTVFDLIKDMSRQLYEAQKRIEGRILTEMEHDEATKLRYINVSGEEKTITVKEGSLKEGTKDPEQVIKDNGYDPNQFGSYVFKLNSWSKLKEKRKLGGDLKALIDLLFTRGKKSLTIS